MTAIPEKNVFILLTPHSYLNACEVQYKLRLAKESIHIYFLTEHRESLRQIENIINSIALRGNSWGEIRFLFGRKGRKIGKNRVTEILFLLRNLVCVFYLNISISKVDRLVISNILNPWMKFLVSHSRAKEIIVLDDGNATIPILQENRKIEEPFRIPPQLKARKNLLLSKLQNSPVMNNRLNFFTVFDTWDDSHTLIKISNDLGYMKQFAGSFERKSEVMIIGSPLVNFGLISSEVFQQVLTSLEKIFTGHELIYVRHRTEGEEFPGSFKCISFDKPVELYLMENKILPIIVASFFSTAGINLHRMFGSQLKVLNLRIQEKLITNQQYSSLLETLSVYYRSQENEYFSIMEIGLS